MRSSSAAFKREELTLPVPAVHGRNRTALPTPSRVVPDEEEESPDADVLLDMCDNDQDEHELLDRSADRVPDLRVSQPSSPLNRMFLKVSKKGKKNKNKQCDHDLTPRDARQALRRTLLNDPVASIPFDTPDAASSESEGRSFASPERVGWRRRRFKDGGLKMAQFTADGTCQFIDQPLTYLLEVYHRSCTQIQGLEKPDLYFRDLNRLVTRETCIIVRRVAILIHLDSIAALILPTECFIVLPEGADEEAGQYQKWFRFFYNMGQRSMATEEGWSGVPFELMALETIFHSLIGVSVQEDEDAPRTISVLRQELHKLEQAERSLGSTNSLERLHELAFEISRFKRRLAFVKSELKGLLEREHDMALMNLSKVCTSPGVYTEENKANWILDHEDIEVILVATLQDLDDISKARKMISSGVDLVRKNISLHIETMRNRLLRIDLYFSSITAMCSIGAVIAGIFGMNLNSEIQDSLNIFWPVAALTFFVPLALAVIFLVTAEVRRWLV